MQLAEKTEERVQISVSLSPDLHAEMAARAEKVGLSLNRTIIQLLRAGLDSERNKTQHLEEALRRYRDCKDLQEAQWLTKL